MMDLQAEEEEQIRGNVNLSWYKELLSSEQKEHFSLAGL